MCLFVCSWILVSTIIVGWLVCCDVQDAGSPGRSCAETPLSAGEAQSHRQASHGLCQAGEKWNLAGTYYTCLISSYRVYLAYESFGKYCFMIKKYKNNESNEINKNLKHSDYV